MEEKKIINREPINVIHIKKNKNRDDGHYIHEKITYDDGSTEHKTGVVRNFKRPFWITDPEFRTYKQKKEFEEIHKLNEYSTTQSDLRKSIANSLGKRNSSDKYKEITKNPYVYGSDISSSAIIRHTYNDKYKNAHKSEVKYAAYDTETNPDKHGNITVNVATLAMGNDVIACVRKDVIKNIVDPERTIILKAKELLGEFIDVDKFNFKIEVGDEETIIKRPFEIMNKVKPNYVGIWNMNYDIPVIIDACDRLGIDSELLFMDPAIDPKYKGYWYKEGAASKLTSSGKYTPVNIADRWHSLIAPTAYQVIDPMCVYRLLRIQNGELSGGYNLDNVLEKELGLRKLKFKEADHLVGMSWHDFMRDNYPVEYIVYAMWDVLSMLELDNKTTDISATVPVFSGISDLTNFKSQPKRIADSRHFETISEGFVTATVGDKYDDPPDKTLGLKDWIVTLPLHMNVNNGLRAIKEYPSLNTNIMTHVFDSDAVSSYPIDTMVLNVSKATTVRELIDIEGIPMDSIKLNNINLMSGSANSIPYCINMFNMPNHKELLELYENK